MTSTGKGKENKNRIRYTLTCERSRVFLCPKHKPLPGRVRILFIFEGGDMYVQKKAIKAFFHENGRRVKPEAIAALDKKVEDLLWSALRLARGFKTITATEIEYANGGRR